MKFVLFEGIKRGKRKKEAKWMREIGSGHVDGGFENDKNMASVDCRQTDKCVYV